MCRARPCRARRTAAGQPAHVLEEGGADALAGDGLQYLCQNEVALLERLVCQAVLEGAQGDHRLATRRGERRFIAHRV